MGGPQVMSACLVASDIRAIRDGEFARATHPAGSYAAFAPLLGAFERVTIISRESRSESLPTGPAMTGPGVAHRSVPDYTSLGGLVRQLWPTIRIVWRSVGSNHAALVRLPEPLSLVVATIALVRRRTLICNVVADPETILATAPKLARHAVTIWTRALVRRCDGAIYVTRHYLQQLVPAPDSTPQLSRSNVRLDYLAKSTRTRPNGAVRLLCVGTTARLNKGQDTLVESLAELRSSGIDASLLLIGGGDHIEWLRAKAKSLRVEEFCEVRGHINDPVELASAYDDSDVFCLLSRTEGLPRAMIEAMSHALPAVGSAVGGLPELLPTHLCLTNPTPAQVATTLKALVSEPDVYEDASKRALRVARDLHEDTSPERLVDFIGSIMSSETSPRR